MKDHTSWNIPERRVAKFLKKEKRNMKNPDGGKSSLLGKILGSNKQRSTKDDPTAPLPEMHPGTRSSGSPSRLGNIVKAFSKKKEQPTTNDNQFRQSKLDTGAEQTALPYKKAEVERKQSQDALEAPAAAAEEEVEETKAAPASTETKAEEDSPTNAAEEAKDDAIYYVDDNDDQTSPCECNACVIL
jgi:hypothetical protein